MKKIRLFLLCGVITATVSGCSFLDIVPDDTATLQDAFKNELAAEQFLRTCYSFQPNRHDFRQAYGIMTSDELVGSPHWNSDWFPHYKIQWGLNNSASPFPMNSNQGYNVDMWELCYQGIRQCYTFLQNIDTVVPTNSSPTDFAANKAKWIGEAWFLIAYYHQLMFQQYGPIVVIEQLQGDNTKYPRLPVDQVSEKICGFYDKAMETLPANWDATSYGRGSGIAAAALKAKTLLYAASPLFNGSQAPYSDLSNTDGTKLFPTYNKERWKAAMDAVAAAINAAKSPGLPDGARALYTHSGDPITTRSGVQFLPTDKRQAYLNCRYLVVEQNPALNRETIWAATSSGNNAGEDQGTSVQSHATPKGLGGRWNQSVPYGGLSVPLSVVKLFYSINGKPVETDPDRGYDWDDRMAVPEGGHSANLHLNREPRFYAAIGYSGSAYEFNGSTEYAINLKRSLAMVDGHASTNGFHNTDPNINMNTDAIATGYALKKTVHPGGASSSSSYSLQQYPYTTIRLADLYLMYVEACAEYSGSLDAAARGYLKEIHDRAGLDGNNIYYADYTGEQLVEAVRRERMIELVFESQWYYDLRRWLMADRWHNAGMWGSTGQGESNGVWGMYALGATDETFYKEVALNPADANVGNVMKYEFDPKRDYFSPLRISTININNQLVQNPGY